MFAINTIVMFSASVQVSQYDEQFIQLFNFATTQLKQVCYILLYPPQTLFVGGILFSRCPSVRPSVRNALFP